MSERRRVATAREDWIGRVERLRQDTEARLRRSAELHTDGAYLLRQSNVLLRKLSGHNAKPPDAAE